MEKVHIIIAVAFFAAMATLPEFSEARFRFRRNASPDSPTTPSPPGAAKNCIEDDDDWDEEELNRFKKCYESYGFKFEDESATSTVSTTPPGKQEDFETIMKNDNGRLSCLMKCEYQIANMTSSDGKPLKDEILKEAKDEMKEDPRLADYDKFHQQCFDSVKFDSAGASGAESCKPYGEFALCVYKKMPIKPCED